MIKEAVFVIGEVCSGKSTFIENKLVEGGKIVELGQLVRDLYKTEERIFDASLDQYLTDKVKEIQMNSNEEFMVIVGCRQVSLLKMLSALFEGIEYYYMHVPRYILKERYQNRAAKKDAKASFEETIENDVKLGIDGLKLHLLNETNCDFIKNY